MAEIEHHYRGPRQSIATPPCLPKNACPFCGVTGFRQLGPCTRCGTYVPTTAPPKSSQKGNTRMVNEEASAAFFDPRTNGLADADTEDYFKAGNNPAFDLRAADLEEGAPFTGE